MRSLLSGLLVVGIGGVAAAEDFKYDLSGENVKVEFVGAKKDGKHVGGFKKLSGTVTAPSADVKTGKVEVVIDIASLYSDHMGLTGHLKGADFFDLGKHKTAKFVSTKVEGDQAKFTMTGDFTLKGKTKSITFPVDVALKDGEYTLKSEFKIDRNDYGMTYGKGKIDDEVVIKLEIKVKHDAIKLPGA